MLKLRPVNKYRKNAIYILCNIMHYILLSAIVKFHLLVATLLFFNSNFT